MTTMQGVVDTQTVSDPTLQLALHRVLREHGDDPQLGCCPKCQVHLCNTYQFAFAHLQQSSRVRT